MAKIKKITIEFDNGTARELTRKQFMAIIRDISYGTVREALEIASKRKKRKNIKNLVLYKQPSPKASAGKYEKRARFKARGKCPYLPKICSDIPSSSKAT